MEGQDGGREAESLQFDKVEYGEGSPSFACAECTRSVTGEYYEAGGRYLCPPCAAQLLSTNGGARRVLAASAYGFVAALIGGMLWYGVRRVTGYEIGLIAIAVGLMVGVAVRMGAKGRGGPRYQALAVFLTYTGIALNYAPDVVSALLSAPSDDPAALAASSSAQPGAPPPSSSAPAPEQAPSSEPHATHSAPEMGLGDALGALATLLGLVLAFSYAAPFLSGFENAIGILIIGFALFEAWKINVPVKINGPYRTGAGTVTDGDGAG